MYTFRCRFRLPPGEFLDILEPRWVLPGTEGTRAVYLMPHGNPDAPIKEAQTLLLKSDGWTSVDDAKDAAHRHVAALTVALMRIGIGADFGGRTCASMLYEAGIGALSEQFEVRVIPDVAGPSVFESEPPARFISIGSSDCNVLRGVDRFTAAFGHALSQNIAFSEREQLAVDLYSSAFFETSIDARFVTLMTAVEALLEAAPRPRASGAHVDDLIRQTRDAVSLSDSEKKSLLSSLDWLRRESISQAGRRPARERLGGRTYGAKPAPTFFTECYKLRSELVHGVHPRPAVNQVIRAEAELRRFVADLLSGGVRDMC